MCAKLDSPSCGVESNAPRIGPAGNGYYPTNNGHYLSDTYGSHTPLSPLEVEINHTIWAPVLINAGGPQSSPQHWNCQPDDHCVNGSRADGWATVTAMVPAMLPIGCKIDCAPEEVSEWGCRVCTHPIVVTGVRYAWSEAPCCPNSNKGIRGCRPGMCPVMTYNSTLPAVPFTAKIVMDNATDEAWGRCECHAPQVCS
jgi:hypothetical protein